MNDKEPLGYDSEGYPLPDTSKCQDCGTTKNVEMRWPGYGFKNYPRCEACGVKRLEREQAANSRYPTHRPSDFDEMDAGERWDEDY